MQRDMAERAERNAAEQVHVAAKEAREWLDHEAEKKRAAAQPPKQDRTHKMPSSTELWDAWVCVKIEASNQNLLRAISHR